MMGSNRADACPFTVAIVAWQSLGAIFPRKDIAVGGLETAAWLTAKALSRLDDENLKVRVHFRAPSYPRDVAESKIELCPDVDPREWSRRVVSSYCQRRNGKWIDFAYGFNGKVLLSAAHLAFTYPWRRMPLVADLPDPRLQIHPADAWFTFGTSLESACVIQTATTQNKPSFLSIQSNADLSESIVLRPNEFSQYGELHSNCRVSIDNASVIICQTDTQQRQLQKVFGRSGVVIRNAIEISQWQQPQPSRRLNKRNSPLVLWVGRYDQFHKRPQLALDIARRCPELDFRLICTAGDENVRKDLHAQATANVKFIPIVPFDKMPSQMGDCDIFLSTGDPVYEGFPNVLLQAAATKRPIVSLEDFDEFLSRSGAGVSCQGDLDVAADHLKAFANQTMQVDHQRVIQYLRQHHDSELIGQQLLKQIKLHAKAA